MKYSLIHWAVVALVAVLGISTSSADSVQIADESGATVVTLDGTASSVACEIFSTLGKAGVGENPFGSDQVLRGTWIQASVSYLNGAQYRAALTISSGSNYGLLPNRCAPQSSCPNASSKIVIGGDVAQELYVDLMKSGAPQTASATGTAVKVGRLSCEELTIEGTRYSCSISVPVAASNAY